VRIIVELLAVWVLVWAAAAVGAVLWLHRRNRVSPAARSRAPLRWLLSPGRAASAHRRLRRAVAAARHAIAHGRRAGEVGVADLAASVADLERHAAALDDQLVLAARCAPAVRRNLLRQLARDVAEVEHLSGRLVRALVAPPPALPGARLEDAARRIAERLDALDAAHAEIAALEASWAGPALPGPAAGSSSRARPLPGHRTS